jgi:3-oxoacyl-[acyl-carrier-protein] synthase-3
VKQTLSDNQMTLDEVDYFIFPQANAFMLNYLRKKTKIPTEKFYIGMSEIGNTVSATIPIALKDAKEQNLIKKGDKVFIAGFGVGYSWGATIIEI